MVTESEQVEVETWALALALEQDQRVVSTETNCEVHHLYGVEDDGEFPLCVSSSLR